MTDSCSELALAAGEGLAGTATKAVRWLLLEQRGAWPPDVVSEELFPEPELAVLRAWTSREPGSRVLLVRRPDRRADPGLRAFVGRTDEARGSLRRLDLRFLGDLLEIDLDHDGEPVPGPLALVCVHGRRDRCCARLGVPLFEALAAHLRGERLWQSSHQGGHRFAANVLVLPTGLHLGRVEPGHAAGVAAAIDAGRIPLDHYRGRTLYTPPVQAAEVVVRRELRLDRPEELRLLEHEGVRVTFATPAGMVDVEVVEEPGAVLPPSCGVAPEPTTRLRATVRA